MATNICITPGNYTQIICIFVMKSKLSLTIFISECEIEFYMSFAAKINDIIDFSEQKKLCRILVRDVICMVEAKNRLSIWNKFFQNFFLRALLFKSANVTASAVCFVFINFFFSQMWVFTVCDNQTHESCFLGFNKTALDEIFPEWSFCTVPTMDLLVAQRRTFQCYLPNSEANKVVFFILNIFFFLMIVSNICCIVSCLFHVIKGMFLWTKTTKCASDMSYMEYFLLSLKFKLGFSGVFLLCLIKDSARFSNELLISESVIEEHYSVARRSVSVEEEVV